MVAKTLTIIFATIFIRFRTLLHFITNRNLNCNLSRDCCRKNRNKSW